MLDHHTLERPGLRTSRRTRGQLDVSIAAVEAPTKFIVLRKHLAKKNCKSYGCRYAGPGYSVQVQFGSKPNSTTSTVEFISLTSTTGKDTATEVRTTSGVGLGSTYATAKKGLAHAKFLGTKQSGYFFIGKGTIGSTDTTVYVTKGLVNLIDVQRIDHAG